MPWILVLTGGAEFARPEDNIKHMGSLQSRVETLRPIHIQVVNDQHHNVCSRLDHVPLNVCKYMWASLREWVRQIILVISGDAQKSASHKDRGSYALLRTQVVSAQLEQASILVVVFVARL